MKNLAQNPKNSHTNRQKHARFLKNRVRFVQDEQKPRKENEKTSQEKEENLATISENLAAKTGKPRNPEMTLATPKTPR